MTADCVVQDETVNANSRFLRFTSGAFTINGNGHSIIGPSNAGLIEVGSSAALNLNNVAIRQSSASNIYLIAVNGASLNGSDILFEDNTNSRLLQVLNQAQISLEEVWFLNNRNTANSNQYGSAVAMTGGLFGGPTVRITNAIFQENAGAPYVIVNNRGTLEFNGCLTFSGNLQADGVTAADNVRTLNGATTDNSVGACSAGRFSRWLPAPPKQSKKKKKADPTPVPTSTPRPQIAATHVALQAETGATFGATFGLDSGVHFRQLDGAGIGIQSIIDAGFLEAFDVYGYVEQGVEVCFPQIGRVIFLDARASPRTIAPLESTAVNGMTCVSINSPGSLVLLPN